MTVKRIDDWEIQQARAIQDRLRKKHGITNEPAVPMPRPLTFHQDLMARLDALEEPTPEQFQPTPKVVDIKAARARANAKAVLQMLDALPDDDGDASA